MICWRDHNEGSQWHREIVMDVLSSRERSPTNDRWVYRAMPR